MIVALVIPLGDVGLEGLGCGVASERREVVVGAAGAQGTGTGGGRRFLAA